MHFVFIGEFNMTHPERQWRKFGQSIWLILWALDNVSEERNGLGLVRGGAAIRDAQIAAEFNTTSMTIHQWRKRLRGRYLHCQHAGYAEGYRYEVDLQPDANPAALARKISNAR